jgi:membrane fusion protein (multidrug efflux system)
VTTVGNEIRDGHVRVECEVVGAVPDLVPAQHGLPGAMEVEVERITPAALVLRLAGEWIGASGRAAGAN